MHGVKLKLSGACANYILFTYIKLHANLVKNQ
ncbi:uncharacterized protein METZ01_LOCUS486591, partial [marine metagenome]